MKLTYLKKAALLLFFSAFSVQSFAQLNLTGQLVHRAEYRHGFGNLITEAQDPAAFIGQRFRLQAEYKIQNVGIYASVQDIRIWGNTSQSNISDNNTSFYEAYSKIGIDSFWNIKLGRQELNYDNARFLGNLDWALQGRAHDFALVTFEKNKSKLHFGGGFNQDNESLNGNVFTTSNQYKTAAMVWFNQKHKNTEISLLFWNDGRQYYSKDSVGKIVNFEVRAHQTIGVPTIKWAKKDVEISGFAYYQMGKDLLDRDISAYDISMQASKMFKNEGAKTRVKATAGVELISGNDAVSLSGSENNAFQLNYGTNHLHNGFMDYFFVGNRGANSTGLNDYFLRLRYDNEVGKKWFASLDAHYFTANGKLNYANPLDSYLGTEIDLSGGVVLNPHLSLQLGYSQLLASSSLQNVRGVGILAASTQNWAYAMLIVRPFSNKKFIGVF